LNTSLTEAFCIAILEAASTGAYIVSTNIGGVREVLPDYMNKLVHCDPEAVYKGLKEAIDNYKKNLEITKNNVHELNEYYNWDKVARRTVIYQINKD